MQSGTKSHAERTAVQLTGLRNSGRNYLAFASTCRHPVHAGFDDLSRILGPGDGTFKPCSSPIVRFYRSSRMQPVGSRSLGNRNPPFGERDGWVCEGHRPVLRIVINWKLTASVAAMPEMQLIDVECSSSSFPEAKFYRRTTAMRSAGRPAGGDDLPLPQCRSAAPPHQTTDDDDTIGVEMDYLKAFHRSWKTSNGLRGGCPSHIVESWRFVPRG